MSFLDIFDQKKNRLQIVERSPRYFSVDAGHRVLRSNVRARQPGLPDRKGCIQGLRGRRGPKISVGVSSPGSRYTTYWGWRNGKG